MTDTLDTEMKTALEACQPGTESLRYLTQLVDIKYKVWIEAIIQEDSEAASYSTSRHAAHYSRA